MIPHKECTNQGGGCARAMTDDAYRQLMKHAHRLAMDGHGELAQFLRDAMTNAQRYAWLRGNAPEHSERWMRWNLQRWDGRSWHSLERAALDAAIDAAREGKA